MNTTDLLLAQADAYECFWNSAIGAAHEAQDSTAMAIAGALAQGYAAVATRLREHASSTPSSGEIIKGLEEKLDRKMKFKPAKWVRTNERQPAVGGTYMTGEWTMLDPKDSVPHFKRTWPEHFVIYQHGNPVWFSISNPKMPITAPEYWLDGMPAAPVPVPEMVTELADMLEAKIEESGALPDGSGFATLSMELPKDHWLYQSNDAPPMPWRIGEGKERMMLAEGIRAAARYAIRAATMSGKDENFAPDAMVQNFIVGMLGYWTEDGLSGDRQFNPEITPPLFTADYADIERRVLAGMVGTMPKFDGLNASGLNSSPTARRASPPEAQELPTLDAMRNASRGNATIGASALWLEAKRVPHSSIVGSGVVFHDKRTGEAVAQIAVMVPNPKYDYRKVADPVIDRIIAKFNEVG